MASGKEKSPVVRRREFLGVSVAVFILLVAGLLALRSGPVGLDGVAISATDPVTTGSTVRLPAPSGYGVDEIAGRSGSGGGSR